MTRTVSSPPFPDSPGSWFALFRQHILGDSGRPLSPEQLGSLLGVSGATVRRWESGLTAPTDQDILHFATLSKLSPHQTAFLRIAFSSAKPPMAPDPETFRESTIRLLADRHAPAILFDELMYPRAWNSYVDTLGAQASALLGQGKHPIEAFFDCQEVTGTGSNQTLSRVRQAVRTVWRYSARYCESAEYQDLIARLRTKPGFDEVWMELASSNDLSAIGITGVAELFLPQPEDSYSVLQSLVAIPPLYALFEYVPQSESARARLMEAQAQAEPKVILDPLALTF